MESPAAETRLAEAAAHLGPAAEPAVADPAVDLAVVGMGAEVAVASRSVARSWSASVPRSHGRRLGPDGTAPMAVTIRHHPLCMGIDGSCCEPVRSVCGSGRLQRYPCRTTVLGERDQGFIGVDRLLQVRVDTDEAEFRDLFQSLRSRRSRRSFPPDLG